MTIAIVDDFDTGEIPRLVGEETVNLPPFTILPPDLRRPDATGEIPIVEVDDWGLGILRPATPAPPVGPRHAVQGPRPAPSRRGRGRHRHPSLLVRAWRRMVGAW